MRRLVKCSALRLVCACVCMRRGVESTVVAALWWPFKSQNKSLAATQQEKHNNNINDNNINNNNINNNNNGVVTTKPTLTTTITTIITTSTINIFDYYSHDHYHWYMQDSIKKEALNRERKKVCFSCIVRRCYIRIRTTPRLGFGSLLLHQLVNTQVGCTVDRDTEMVSERSPEVWLPRRDLVVLESRLAVDSW